MRSTDETDAETVRVITEFGHQNVVVPDATPTFGYTVGLSLQNRPELYMVGDLHPLIIHEILNIVASLPAALVTPGALLDEVLEGGLKVRLDPCDPTAAEMFQAIRFAEVSTPAPLQALQIVWPSPEGLFPDQPGYDHSLYTQPRHLPKEENDMQC